VERMTDIYNKTQARFADFKTQIVTVRPSRSELITGDTLFTDGHKVGLRQGLAILDANCLHAPRTEGGHDLDDSTRGGRCRGCSHGAKVELVHVPHRGSFPSNAPEC
jgi:hypothetical protein